MIAMACIQESLIAIDKESVELGLLWLLPVKKKQDYVYLFMCRRDTHSDTHTHKHTYKHTHTYVLTHMYMPT